MKLHDIHIHTTLSACCSDPQALPENYLQLAADRGLTVIGFSNHFWDRAVDGATPWYASQDYDHLCQLRLPKEEGARLGIRVLFGCETEYAQGTLAITPQRAKDFDYVLIPHTHMHMKDFVIPAAVTDPDELAAFMLRTYREVVSFRLGVPTSIAHPFVACGYPAKTRLDLLGRISDDDFRRAFSLAAENGVGLELNTDGLPLLPEYPNFQGHPMVRMYRLAKECGVKFTLGSDAHALMRWSNFFHCTLFLQACGITEEDYMDFLK